ncbi:MULTISPECIES: hypothetical protein [unclassified Sphingomonas]|uniref:hypothetical protein n=1 Tax=unclassified Sphingomonas TaxID=196159 RepID=UPI0006FF384C|nr:MULTISPECIES: hypothetical protein [unclassified Sphingomonas]KQM28929.1 hypothetical protein ASE58_03515 [Sphingomonas sp. Leaf9]KQM45630.1 hypothetical protein ASE57_03505 [Sphingomonas sp. Leaf11]
MSPWRPEFVAGLELFARISSEMARRGFGRPVLVGGAAVEIYSGGIVATGDFDIVVARDDVLVQIFVETGFERPHGAGVATRGWVYRDLRLGFEIVDTVLLDGAADRNRVRMLSVSADDAFEIISVEDLIADRMGQYGSGTAQEMLGQAQILFELSPELDMDYLERRIREETSNEHGIATLRSGPGGHVA